MNPSLPTAIGGSTEAGHTPGPWRSDAINSWNVWARDCKVAATYGLSQGSQYREPPQEERIANARLIAAAPELLEELEQQADGTSTIISLLAGQTGPVAASLVGMLRMQEQAARAAISKALGQ